MALELIRWVMWQGRVLNVFQFIILPKDESDSALSWGYACYFPFLKTCNLTILASCCLVTWRKFMCKPHLSGAGRITHFVRADVVMVSVYLRFLSLRFPRRNLQHLQSMREKTWSHTKLKTKSIIIAGIKSIYQPFSILFTFIVAAAFSTPSFRAHATFSIFHLSTFGHHQLGETSSPPFPNLICLVSVGLLKPL